jgi:hypothetical protein
MASDDYKVGYGKPPKHTQFKKDQRANPKGRPRTVKNFSTLLRQEVQKKVVVTENGRRRKITKLEAGATQVANNMARGDLKTTQFVVGMTQEGERKVDTSAEQSSFTEDEDARKYLRELLLTVRDRLLQAQPGRTDSVGHGSGAGGASGKAVD